MGVGDRTELRVVLEDRERRFREFGVDSMATYRRMRADGRVTDDPFGDVFLVVDGWGVLRGEFEELEATIIAMAARSLTYGVHIVLATNRWMDLRLGMRDIVGTKTELRIGDAIDSEIVRNRVARALEESFSIHHVTLQAESEPCAVGEEVHA